MTHRSLGIALERIILDPIRALGTNLAVHSGNYKHMEGLTIALMTSSYGSTQSQDRHPLTPLVGCFLSGRNSVLLPLLATLLLAVVGSAQAATYNSNGSLADVIAKVALASNGDTVTLPAGTFIWPSVLTITNKAITLQGAGVGQTIIRDGVTTGALLTWALVANQPHRLTGIEFRNNGRITQEFNGILQITGNGTLSDTGTMRIDHNDFEGLNGTNIQLVNVIGVADHNTYSGVPTSRFANIFHPNWDGGVYGDKSFTDGNRFGTNKFFFFEDNTFTYTGSNNYAFLDSWMGGRWVARYNTVIRGWFEAHGTDSGQRLRSTRAIEIYNNIFTGNDTNAYIVNVRGGAALIHHNTATGYMANPRFEVAAYRVNPGTWVPWGRADGTNQWDLNSGGVLVEALDQPGRSGGSLITGDTPVLPWTAGLNNQVDDPCYEWNNTEDGSNVSFVSGHSVVRGNEHFFNDTAKPGYTPYTYPHPLVSPVPPSNLHIPGP